MGESYWNQTGDPYQYAGSSVLKNIPNLKDADALDVFEHRATALRLDEAVESAAGKPVSLALWQYIHRTLFQDVYGWAGEIRSVQLAKGSTVFAMPEHIETEAARIFKELATDNLSDPGRLAFYFGELNVLHPFREGNGRTQKLLFDEVVRREGKRIDWSVIDVDVLLQALITAFNKQDYQPLEKLFRLALKTA